MEKVASYHAFADTKFAVAGWLGTPQPPEGSGRQRIIRIEMPERLLVSEPCILQFRYKSLLDTSSTLWIFAATSDTFSYERDGGVPVPPFGGHLITQIKRNDKMGIPYSFHEITKAFRPGINYIAFMMGGNNDYAAHWEINDVVIWYQISV